MPWFRLDDTFHSHPKVIKAGNEAIGLYVRCGSYAAQHLTDGFVPEHVALLYGTPELADTLVGAKLWRRVRAGWRMPDYLQYNPSKQAVENERKQAAERQKRRRTAMSSRRDSARSSATPTPKGRDPDGSLTLPAANGRAPSKRRSPLAKPPWCGACDETTRQWENPDTGLPMRCPACHPLEQGQFR
jgi:hypothetical protein